MKPTLFAFGLGLLLMSRLTIGAETKMPPHPDNSLVDGSAIVTSWSPPVYPPDALQQKIGGRTTVRIIVDEQGTISAARVLKAADPRLGEAALAAVKTWKFTPAMENQKPIACCLDVPLNFNATKGAESWPPAMMTSLNNQPRNANTTEATPKLTPPGDYPAILAERKLSGLVRFSSRVDPTGRLIGPRILATTHADFVLPALAALTRWEFTPAKQGDLAIATEVVGEVSFDEIGGSRADVLAANGIAGPDGGAPAAHPQLLTVVDPVWPLAPLLKGTGGEAVIEFTVETNGRVTNAQVRSSTQADFGQAALAALEASRFRPALSEGRTIAVSLMQHVAFAAVPIASTAAESKDDWVTLVQAARAGTIGEAHGLDQKLTPILRVPPLYPAALLAAGRPKGAAEIEFVIARDGRARLPRAVTATHEAFGWAAATAVSQWVFEPPRRGGQPVDVKVQIPFTFSAPEL